MEKDRQPLINAESYQGLRRCITEDEIYPVAMFNGDETICKGCTIQRVDRHTSESVDDAGFDENTDGKHSRWECAIRAC